MERCAFEVDWGRPGVFWGSGQLTSSACHLLALAMRVRVVLLTCRRHLSKTAGMVVIKVMAAVD